MKGNSLWVASNRSGIGGIYLTKPIRGKNIWLEDSISMIVVEKKEMISYFGLTWEDEPLEIKLNWLLKNELKKIKSEYPSIELLVEDIVELLNFIDSICSSNDINEIEKINQIKSIISVVLIGWFRFKFKFNKNVINWRWLHWGRIC